MFVSAASDIALVRRLLAGEERAFQEFFAGHFSRLFRFALTRLGGRADAAEEVAQATLCAAVAHLGTYRGESALFTWLCAICRHEISRHCAARGVPHAVAGFAEESEEGRAALDSLAAAFEDGPEARLHQTEIARLVQVTLDNLPCSYASALEWKYLQDLSVKEIASRLQLSLKAAESLLGRARAAFRDSFTTLTRVQSTVRPSGGGSGRTGST